MTESINKECWKKHNVGQQNDTLNNNTQNKGIQNDIGNGIQLKKHIYCGLIKSRTSLII